MHLTKWSDIIFHLWMMHERSVDIKIWCVINEENVSYSFQMMWLSHDCKMQKTEFISDELDQMFFFILFLKVSLTDDVWLAWVKLFMIFSAWTDQQIKQMKHKTHLQAFIRLTVFFKWLHFVHCNILLDDNEIFQWSDSQKLSSAAHALMNSLK